MTTGELDRLKAAAVTRNPILGRLLQPGLPEAKIRKAFARAKVSGDIEPIVQIYQWHNGTFLSRELAMSKTGFFPEDIYQFLDLEMALGHTGHIKESAKFHPHLQEGVGRYVPIFWDGSTSWLAVDVTPDYKHRIMIIEPESDQPFREAYGSLNEFILDAIRANEESDTLRCFQNQ